jgi:competence protein ComEA
MSTEKLNWVWLVMTGVLILIILAGGIFFMVRHNYGQAVTISRAVTPTFCGEVYVDGAVQQPGSYPYAAADTLNSIIAASGGTRPEADLSSLQLHIGTSISTPGNQKVDLNHADKWLLQAVPGIGEVKAQAILEYRRQIGYFHNIDQLTQVPGITPALLDKIRDYITTSD